MSKNQITGTQLPESTDNVNQPEWIERARGQGHIAGTRAQCSVFLKRPTVVLLCTYYAIGRILPQSAQKRSFELSGFGCRVVLTSLRAGGGCGAPTHHVVHEGGETDVDVLQPTRERTPWHLRGRYTRLCES